ncbi:uncharacterized protein LOC126355967 [Schistocerca gregaria]|uniref:uncharacterized protein LOC126355967 n=1 Tax=Schistocerca gregaria TaxID=7010 RepID=UPI00211EFDFD|nr:uncharacterized protein LOC126355967 [Schistocerca gregaria]
MSKDEFRKRLDALIGNAGSSSTCKTEESNRNKTLYNESVWGNKPPSMSKGDFHQRLVFLIDKSIGTSTSKTDEGEGNRGNTWESEIGELPKSMKKDDFRKRLSHLWREGQLVPTDRCSEIKERKSEAKKAAQKVNTFYTMISNDGEIKTTNIDSGDQQREDSIFDGLLRWCLRGFFRGRMRHHLKVLR